ncbi:MAG: hypothetical protein CMC35_08150 [Flavobacteriaceae bacterium]|nr:hypothetical protein [Flavobacteriaceae bacterium]|tara:strand:- start:20895 stop:21872 length:978 start_codon:yes stop_codon:yes gene_type:complete
MDTSNPHDLLLSVRLMTYNHAPFIEEAMRSVDAQQTNFEYEVVVGDDFSTDGNMERIQQFESENPKAHWKILQRSKGDAYHKERLKNGRVQNFYDLMKHCKGKYVALLDGDDYWTDTNKLQLQVDFLEAHPEAVGCFHNSVVVDEHSKETWPRYFEGEDGTWYDQEACLKTLRSSYSTAALVIRNDAIQDQLEQFLQIGTDFILELMVTNHGKLCFIDKSMSAYRFHEGGIWQGSTEAQNNAEIIKRYLFLYRNEPFRSRYNNYLWNFIIKFYHNQLRRAESDAERKAIKRQIQTFLAPMEWRTFRYYGKRLQDSLRYRFKKLRK